MSDIVNEGLSRSGCLDIVALFLPSELSRGRIDGRTVVVFDVLRATTSMIAALAAGVSEIRIFGDTHSAAEASRDFGGRKVLCGEVDCLPPQGFDLGNSPKAFHRSLHGDFTAFLSTTNGTKAVIAAREAPAILIGAIVNASAVAEHVAAMGRPVTLLCAGTRGEPAMEDILGAGAVIDALIGIGAGEPAEDGARVALRLFRACRNLLTEAMSDAKGGRHLLAAGLGEDIPFCAELDSIPVVGVVSDHPLRVTKG